MKPKHLFFLVFITALVLSGYYYLNGHPYLAVLMLLMALASALNASKPEANKKATFKDISRLFIEQR